MSWIPSLGTCHGTQHDVCCFYVVLFWILFTLPWASVSLLVLYLPSSSYWCYLTVITCSDPDPHPWLVCVHVPFLCLITKTCQLYLCIPELRCLCSCLLVYMPRFIDRPSPLLPFLQLITCRWLPLTTVLSYDYDSHLSPNEYHSASSTYTLQTVFYFN